MKNCITLIALFALGGVCLNAAEKPSVIFFAVDDMCDWVGEMGDQQAVTPHLDSLARKGVLFTNAHCSGVYGAPSRLRDHQLGLAIHPL